MLNDCCYSHACLSDLRYHYVLYGDDRLDGGGAGLRCGSADAVDLRDLASGLQGCRSRSLVVAR